MLPGEMIFIFKCGTDDRNRSTNNEHDKYCFKPRAMTSFTGRLLFHKDVIKSCNGVKFPAKTQRALSFLL